VTEARLEAVYEDRIRAREFLSHAGSFLDDADQASLGAPSRVVLLHNAAICACDAILQAAGLRVAGGEGSHALRLEAALDQIAGDTDELLESLDASRARRNEASYEAMFVAAASVSDAREATGELIARAEAFVARGA
jgi:hypothetical protein